MVFNELVLTVSYLQTAEINLNLITTSLQCYLIYRLIALLFKDCTQQASTENYITQILTTADAMLKINSFQNPKRNTIQYWFLQK